VEQGKEGRQKVGAGKGRKRKSSRRVTKEEAKFEKSNEGGG
jgi:hypothetical protein